METDLTPLPCPFCGAKPEWSHSKTGSMPGFTDGVQRVWRWQSSLICTCCRLPSCSGFGEVRREGGNALAHQYAMERALRQWNRRIPRVQNAVRLTHDEMRACFERTDGTRFDVAIVIEGAVLRKNGFDPRTPGD